MAPKKGSKKVAEDSEDLDINEEVEEPKPTKSATKPKATKEKNPPQENAKAKNSTAKKNSGANGKAKSKEDNKLLELIGDINVEHEVDPDELPTLINASYIDATTCGSSLTLCEHLVVSLLPHAHTHRRNYILRFVGSKVKEMRQLCL